MTTKFKYDSKSFKLTHKILYVIVFRKIKLVTKMYIKVYIAKI